MIRQRPFSSAFSQTPPFYDAGLGVWSAAPLNYTPPTPPVISNGILLENGTDFLMMEDGTSYILQEA
jgi:hypothetical protein